ncbi:LysR family transcriptional regulator [Paenibacillus sp. FJAT-26967]|uniref:LysR family transcriptional regulator n=1 Tax=Paenibacillus sp. FJAT-26967 TaxID=1729690 RepID=UPI000837EA41|nr:LysR family transcriptional regulator [Paenibacillus sp. FJAT-26967]
MEIKQLITFIRAADLLNFTQTAHELNFAQSSVTAQIKTLEAELGAPLFERLGKRLALTEAGRQFREYAARMIQLSEEAKIAVQGHDFQSGTLIIGAQESMCTYRLPPLLQEFRARFPRVKLIFKPAHSDASAREQLHSGQLDAAFILDGSRPPESLTIKLLTQEQLKMVASPQHPLLAQDELTPLHFARETLLLTENGCSYRTLLEEYFREEGVHPANKLEFVSIEAIKQCVIANLGIALLPAMAVRKELEEERMKELPWNNRVAPLFIQLAWHKDKWISPPLKAFIELAERQLAVKTDLLAASSLKNPLR